MNHSHDFGIGGDLIVSAVIVVAWVIALRLIRPKTVRETRVVSDLQRIRARNSLISAPFLIFLDICGLVTVNTSGQKGNLGANVFLGLGLVVLVGGSWVNANTLRRWKLQQEI